MNKPTRENSKADVFPKGVMVAWADATDAMPASLGYMHPPTVVIKTDPESPVSFEGSLDGETFAPIRDKDGDLVRFTKAGVYRLPVSICFLRPVTLKPVAIQTFIQR
jgi:hypothetical protein